MAVDTLAKRASIVLANPIPDGTIGQNDRQTIVWTYGGILASTITVVQHLVRPLTRALTRNLTRGFTR